MTVLAVLYNYSGCAGHEFPHFQSVHVGKGEMWFRVAAGIVSIGKMCCMAIQFVHIRKYSQ